MSSFRIRRLSLALVAGVLIVAGGASAQPSAYLQPYDVPPPDGDGPVWYGQSYYWGGRQAPGLKGSHSVKDGFYGNA